MYISDGWQDVYVAGAHLEVTKVGRLEHGGVLGHLGEQAAQLEVEYGRGHGRHGGPVSRALGFGAGAPRVKQSR